MSKWFKRDTSKPDEPTRPLPRWMAWLLFGFIGYLVIVGNVTTMQPPTTSVAVGDAPAPSATVQDFPAIRRTFSLANWQRAFDPTLSEGVSLRDFTQGAGRQAACGDEVTLSLRGRDAKGQPFDTKHDESKPLTFIVGKKDTYPAVEQAVIGMQAGGERIVDAPPALVYDEAESARTLSTVTLQTQLVALAPPIEETTAPLLLATDRVSGANEDDAAAPPALCGDKIDVDVTLWDERGEKPSKLKNNTLTLGARELALGIDHALPGIIAGETRILLLPPAYQLHEGNDSPFDGKALRLVEITRVK